MARILVAASPETRAILQRVLASHELEFAETMAQAEPLVREQAFDLVIATILFDESRMFDLLRLTKSLPDRRSIPFVCARIRPSVLNSRIALEGIRFTCRALGAEAFLDMANYEVEPESEFRRDVEQFLDPTLRAGRGYRSALREVTG